MEEGTTQVRDKIERADWMGREQHRGKNYKKRELHKKKRLNGEGIRKKKTMESIYTKKRHGQKRDINQEETIYYSKENI